MEKALNILMVGLTASLFFQYFYIGREYGLAASLFISLIMGFGWPISIPVALVWAGVHFVTGGTV
jgi:hypothetical protein